MTYRNLNPWLAAGVVAAALLVRPAGTAAQGIAPSPASAAVAGSADRSVTLNLRDTPLRTALQMLFEGSGLQHAVENTVPNVPITLQIRDIPFQTALRTLVRLAGVTFQKEGEIFIVRPRQTAPEPTASAIEPPAPVEIAAVGGEAVEKIPINFLHPAVLAYVLNAPLIPTEDQVQPGFGGAGGLGGYGGSGGFGGNNGFGGSGGNFYGGGNGLGIGGNLGLGNGGQGSFGQPFGNPGAYPGGGGAFGPGTGLGINPTGNSLIVNPRARRF